MYNSEYTENHQIARFKWVNCTVCAFSLNKDVLKSPVQNERPLGALRRQEQVTGLFFFFFLTSTKLKIREIPKEGNTKCRNVV